MSWGACFMYYICPRCGKKFKCAIDLIPELGEHFGCCPVCEIPGKFEKEGARTPDDLDYEEIE